jgi:hypothetical protein
MQSMCQRVAREMNGRAPAVTSVNAARRRRIPQCSVTATAAWREHGDESCEATLADNRETRVTAARMTRSSTRERRSRRRSGSRQRTFVCACRRAL